MRRSYITIYDCEEHNSTIMLLLFYINKHMSRFALTKLMVAWQANQIEILVTISVKLLKYILTSDKGMHFIKQNMPSVEPGICIMRILPFPPAMFLTASN